MSEQGAYGWQQPPPPTAWQPVGTAPPRGVSLSTGGAVAAALALLVVGAVGGGLVVAVIGWFAPAPLVSLVVGQDGDVAAFDLAPGDCASGVLDVGATPSTPRRVPCDEPHEVEVYAVAEPLPDGVAPDLAALDAHATGWCEIGFQRFVGIDYWSSDLDMWPLIPDGDAWRSGERRIACLVSTLDGGLLEGSVAGTAR